MSKKKKGNNDELSLVNYLLKSKTVEKDVTFTDAKYQSIHRWFPYLEGFSETFINDIIKHIPFNFTTIYEPFAGSGTLPVHSFFNDYNIYYSEVNSFLQKLISTKLSVISLSKKAKQILVKEIEAVVTNLEENLNGQNISKVLEKTYNDTFPGLVYFPKENFELILKMHSLIENTNNNNLKEILSIASCEALLPASYLKRQGDIRYKRPNEHHQIVNFKERLTKNLYNIIEDISLLPELNKIPSSYFTKNAKDYDNELENKIEVIITSPPYLNGTNYIRNTKLELWFLGFLKEKKDLNYYRRLVVTAGINDVGKDIKSFNIPLISEIINDASLWYDKRIPKMINDYFYDMHKVLYNSYRYLKKNGLIYIDIGDSIYGGIHIPTDLILIEIARNIGFTIKDNIMLRERKSKSGEIVKQTLIVAVK